MRAAAVVNLVCAVAAAAVLSCSALQCYQQVPLFGVTPMDCPTEDANEELACASFELDCNLAESVHCTAEDTAAGATKSVAMCSTTASCTEMQQLPDTYQNLQCCSVDLCNAPAESVGVVSDFDGELGTEIGNFFEGAFGGIGDSLQELVECSDDLIKSCPLAMNMMNEAASETVVEFNAEAGLSREEYDAICGDPDCSAAWDRYFACAQRAAESLPGAEQDFQGQGTVHMSAICNCPFPVTEECVAREMGNRGNYSPYMRDDPDGSSGTVHGFTWRTLLFTALLMVFTAAVTTIYSP